MAAELTPDLMRQARFAQIGEFVHDRIPGSDFMQGSECAATSQCWRARSGMWLCSPCLMRFRDVRHPMPALPIAPAESRLADHIREHLAAGTEMLLGFWCPAHNRMERPELDTAD